MAVGTYGATGVGARRVGEQVLVRRQAHVLLALCKWPLPAVAGPASGTTSRPTADLLLPSLFDGVRKVEPHPSPHPAAAAAPPRSVVLCGDVLCSDVLWCDVLCGNVLCGDVLCCAVMCCAVLCCAVLCRVVLCCAVMCCVVSCSYPCTRLSPAPRARVPAVFQWNYWRRKHNVVAIGSVGYELCYFYGTPSEAVKVLAKEAHQGTPLKRLQWCRPRDWGGAEQRTVWSGGNHHLPSPPPLLPLPITPHPTSLLSPSPTTIPFHPNPPSSPPPLHSPLPTRPMPPPKNEYTAA
ncbi:unnamed protein product [Closterium sp. Naga37s-1]|nr:unnamed protein product [Closterium sp. Naga37s-1]